MSEGQLYKTENVEKDANALINIIKKKNNGFQMNYHDNSPNVIAIHIKNAEELKVIKIDYQKHINETSELKVRFNDINNEKQSPKTGIRTFDKSNEEGQSNIQEKIKIIKKLEGNKRVNEKHKNVCDDIEENLHENIIKNKEIKDRKSVV